MELLDVAAVAQHLLFERSSVSIELSADPVVEGPEHYLPERLQLWFGINTEGINEKEKTEQVERPVLRFCMLFKER